MMMVLTLRMYCGDRLIPTTLITAVATNPEYRRRGYAVEMFREMLEVIRGAGYPLSVLYPFSF